MHTPENPIGTADIPKEVMDQVYAEIHAITDQAELERLQEELQVERNGMEMNNPMRKIVSAKLHAIEQSLLRMTM